MIQTQTFSKSPRWGSPRDQRAAGGASKSTSSSSELPLKRIAAEGKWSKKGKQIAAEVRSPAKKILKAVNQSNFLKTKSGKVEPTPIEVSGNFQRPTFASWNRNRSRGPRLQPRQRPRRGA